MAQIPARKAAVKTVPVKKVASKKAAVKVAAKKAPTAKKAVVATKPAVKVDAKAVVKAAPVKVAKTDKPVKLKVKLVRDSFTMPADDWALIDQLKARAIGFKRPTKKSELLRAGLQVLAALPDSALQASLDKLQPLKPGRPKTDKK